jgi:PGF-CTERM protein
MTRKQLTTSLTFGALLVATALFGTVALTGGAAAADATTNNTSATLTFDDQTLENGTVTVSGANLSDGGYVAVTNASGAVLGHSEYLEAGVHENVTVALSADPARGGVFIATAYLDDGDESFNASADPAYVNENDVAISSTAYVTVEGSDAAPETTETTETETTTETTETTEATTTVAETTEAAETTADATGETTSTEGPGFGVVAAVVGLLGAALFVARSN